MKKLFLTLIISCFCLLVKGQHKEIDFQSVSFNQALELAKKENKLIFIDCYTSWCAPCKWMDKFVFVQKEVYDLYNSSFINLKIDMEKTEGPELGKKYAVSSYPSYLFINGKGEIVHRAGSKMPAEQFIELAKNAKDPQKQLASLATKYDAGKCNLDEKLDYALALKKANNPKKNVVVKDIISPINSNWMQTVNGWHYISNFLEDEQTELFHFMDSHKAVYEKLVGKDAVNKVYANLLQRKMYKTSLDQNEVLFFKQLDSLKKMSKNYRDIAIVHCGYYLKGNNAKEFKKTSDYYLTNYLQKDPETIAFIARQTSYPDVTNKDIIKQGQLLIEKAYKMNPNDYGTVGTYAQIQSKVGNKNEAIKAAELAVKMADTISSKVKNRALQNLEEIKKMN